MIDEVDCLQLEWNPIGSATAHSALAGVLGALVFAGIVVLLQDQRRSSEYTRALELMSGALLALAFSSFLYGVVAGGQVCIKYWTHTLLASGLLGLGGMGVFGGISWLFNAYDKAVGPHDAASGLEYRQAAGKATGLAVMCSYTVAVIVAYHLKSTAGSYLGDLQESGLNTPPGWLVRVVDYYLPLFIVAIALLALPALLGGRVRRPRWLTRRTGHTSDASRPLRARERRANRAALYAARLTVAYVLVVALASGVLLDRWIDQWEPETPTHFVVLATLLSLLVPTVGLLAHLRALPPLRPTEPEPDTTQPDPADVQQTDQQQDRERISREISRHDAPSVTIESPGGGVQTNP